MVTESALQFSLFKSKTHFFGPASARSYKISFVGNNWFVGNAVFWETAVSIFLIFCMKLRGYKGRKVTEPDFWNKFLIWRYSEKRLQISPKSDILIFFSKTALMIYLVFGLKLVLNMTFDLVLNWIKLTFQKELLFGDIWPQNHQNLVVFLQFTGPVNAFLCSNGFVTLHV